MANRTATDTYQIVASIIPGNDGKITIERIDSTGRAEELITFCPSTLIDEETERLMVTKGKIPNFNLMRGCLDAQVTRMRASIADYDHTFIKKGGAT